ISATFYEFGLILVLGIKYLFRYNYLLVFFFIDNIIVLVFLKYTKELYNFKKKLLYYYKIIKLGKLK
ncbi:hypothetical protein EJ08DRAFT_598396, partial [Tothia fuscella]